MEEILTASELASLLKIDVRTIYRLARQGAIPGIKFGGSWRFSKSLVLDMVSPYREKDQKYRANRERPNKSG